MVALGHIKLEKEVETLRSAVSKLSRRIGDEIVGESDSDDSEIIVQRPEIHTQHYQRDTLLGKRYFYITNVSNSHLKISYIHNPN